MGVRTAYKRGEEHIEGLESDDWELVMGMETLEQNEKGGPNEPEPLKTGLTAKPTNPGEMRKTNHGRKSLDS